VRGYAGGRECVNPEKIWGKWSFMHTRTHINGHARTHDWGTGVGGGYGVCESFIYTVLSQSTESKTGGGVKLWGTLSHIQFYMISSPIYAKPMLCELVVLLSLS